MGVVSSGSSLAARRKLAAELRGLRDGAGMTIEEVAEELGCHISKISRIETAKRNCTGQDFKGLMDLYDVSAERREELAELMSRAKQRTPPWWHAYGEIVTHNYSEFMSYEAEAVRSCEYQSVLIPGLLQTEDYARAVTGPGFTVFDPDQIDSLVEVRMTRQKLVRDDDPLVLDAVVTEAALRILVGGIDVMRGQLRHLSQVTRRDNIRFRVIPFEAGQLGAMTGAFVLFGTQKDSEPDAAFMESTEGSRFSDDLLALRRLNRLFKNLSDAALSEDDSRELVIRIEKELV
ncbi:helix-turn-helix domain-containing protein [Streptomyces sp. SBT349]|uniref:helix-turn-helix domain-containing protein n=1 Tax=Streptomyces sp. SBT349 TaxID=1580539 RepID=UPI00066E8085|nr:helix-turn-helix transcriptional regulator [Streptomyces sp. SBT349]